MPLRLPASPNLEQLRKQAKELLALWRAGDAEALAALREHHPEHSPTHDSPPPLETLRLADAQLVTARRYGLPSWPRLKEEVEIANLAFAQRAERFVRLAADESPGPVEGPFLSARRLLEREPEIARSGVYAALVIGDLAAVRSHLERDPDWARRKGGPLPKREPLHYAAYSKFHRQGPEIAAGLLAIARLLLDQGADPSASFPVDSWPACPLRALCGACGIANFSAMAELLLERGALLDDGESLYHSLEHSDTRCLEILLARGASPKGTNALHHALDVPGSERLRRLLEAGADPNEVLAQDGTVLHRAIQKGRPRLELELLLAHGADPRAKRRDGRTPLQVAYVAGHREAAELLAGTAPETPFSPFERLADACASGDLEAARDAVETQPDLFATLAESDRQAFLQLAQNGNAPLIEALLAAGFPVGARGEHSQTALHWASWHGWRETVEVLLAHGAEVNALETEFEATPLAWAAHGCENRPNPEGDYPGVVRLLLAAGSRPLEEGQMSEALLEMGAGAEEVYLLLRRPAEGEMEEGGGSEEGPGER